MAKEGSRGYSALLNYGYLRGQDYFPDASVIQELADAGIVDEFGRLLVTEETMRLVAKKRDQIQCPFSQGITFNGLPPTVWHEEWIGGVDEPAVLSQAS